MGLLTDPGATKNLSAKIDKFGDKLGALGFIAGLAWLVAQSCAEYNAKSYIDENALMPGLAKTRFTEQHEQLSLKVGAELDYCSGANYRSCQLEIIEKYARLMGHRTEQSNWSYCGGRSSCVGGVNLVVQSRIKSSLNVESIVINVPMYKEHDELNLRQKQNHGVGVAIALMEMIKRQAHWAKQFHFVFTEHERRGIECWTEYNFGLMKKCTHEQAAPLLIAHSPQSGLVLDIASEQFTAVDMQMEGDLSQMTNQDIVNVAVRVANRLGIAVTIGGQTGPTEPDQPSRLFLTQLLQLGTGEGTGNHATLIAHGIQAITLKTTNVGSKVNYRQLNIMHLAESILRSQNNLLERLHASIWFYMFSSINHYASISLYMPTAGLLLLLPLLFGLKRWLTSSDISLGDFAEQMRPVLLLAFSIQLVTFGGLTLVRLYRDYLIPVALVCLVVCPLLSLLCRRSYHAKISASVILIYSLQCGLLSLVCFSQGFLL